MSYKNTQETHAQVRDDDLVLAVAAELGLVIDNCSPGFAAAATYILFDTRMDLEEAHMGPLHPQAHEFRWAGGSGVVGGRGWKWAGGSGREGRSEWVEGGHGM
mgnify:CR=1 FL=1